MVLSSADLAAYVASVRSRYIDVDGQFGPQCWDQWSHYAQWLGVPAWPTYTNAGGAWPHPGWACNVYHNAAAAGLTRWFEILPASATPRAGDVVFMELGSAFYPYSHVATALDSPSKGGMLRCLTQNPGAVQIADLIMHGIIGYLRPRGLVVGAVDASKTPTLTASQKQKEVAPMIRAMYYRTGSKYIVTVGDQSNGWKFPYEGDREFNDKIAKQFGITVDFLETDKSTCDAFRRSLDEVRTGR